MHANVQRSVYYAQHTAGKASEAGDLTLYFWQWQDANLFFVVFWLAGNSSLKGQWCRVMLYLAGVLCLILVDKIHQEKPLEKKGQWDKRKMSDRKKKKKKKNSKKNLHILLPEHLLIVKTMALLAGNVTFCCCCVETISDASVKQSNTRPSPSPNHPLFPKSSVNGNGRCISVGIAACQILMNTVWENTIANLFSNKVHGIK